MNTENILLKEYEVAQNHLIFLMNYYWQIFAIFMPVNTAFLGAVTYAVIQKVPYAWLLALMLGLVSIVLTVFLLLYSFRVNFFIGVDYYRMREIERKLGMSKNWMVHYLDECNKLKLNDKELGRCMEALDYDYDRVSHLRKSYVGPSGRKLLPVVFCAIILMWVVCIILSFVLHSSGTTNETNQVSTAYSWLIYCAPAILS